MAPPTEKKCSAFSPTLWYGMTSPPRAPAARRHRRQAKPPRPSSRCRTKSSDPASVSTEAGSFFECGRRVAHGTECRAERGRRGEGMKITEVRGYPVKVGH